MTSILFIYFCSISLYIPAVRRWFYPYMRIFLYSCVWGLPPPVKAGRRHMTLKVSVQLKTPKKIKKQNNKKQMMSCKYKDLFACLTEVNWTHCKYDAYYVQSMLLWKQFSNWVNTWTGCFCLTIKGLGELLPLNSGELLMNMLYSKLIHLPFVTKTKQKN